MTWRRALFGLVNAVLLAAVPVLAWFGFRSVLDTTEGRSVDPQLDPDEPGYEALLEPTPVELVVGTDAEGGLSWMTVLVLDPGRGAVIQVPVATLVHDAELGSVTLREAWAEGGQPVAVQAASDLLGAGFGDVVVVDPDRVAALFAPVAPLSVVNADPLPDFDPGELDLDGEEVAAYLQARADGETDLARLARHEVVWRAWLAAIATSADPDVVPGESTVGLGRFVRGIAAAEPTFDVIPVTSTEPRTTTTSTTSGSEGAGSDSAPADEVFTPDEEGIATLINNVVPFPVASRPGARPRVRVLDGVGADGLALRVARDVVRAGGQVVVVGNADRFDAATSRVVFFDEELADVAAEIAEGAGVDAPEREAGPNPNDLVDVTVVAGADLASAYGLLPRG